MIEHVNELFSDKPIRSKPARAHPWSQEVIARSVSKEKGPVQTSPGNKCISDCVIIFNETRLPSLKVSPPYWPQMTRIVVMYLNMFKLNNLPKLLQNHENSSSRILANQLIYSVAPGINNLPKLLQNHENSSSQILANQLIYSVAPGIKP